MPTRPTDTRDPFTQTQRALWHCLDEHLGLARLVKMGNRQRHMTDTGDHRKPNVQAGDLPELDLVPTAFSAVLSWTSQSAEVVRRFELRTVTGEPLLDAALFPLEWQLLRAIGSAAERAPPLGLPWVTDLTVEEASQQQSGDDLARGADGWTAVMVIAVRMRFDRAKQLKGSDPELGDV